MEIISEKKSIEIVKEEICKYNDLEKIPTYYVWKKLEPYIIVLSFILSSTLAISSFRFYENDIVMMFGADEINLFLKLVITILGFALIIFVLLIMVCLHEMLHWLCYKVFNSKSQCFLVLNRSLGLSVLCRNWQTKFCELCNIILPFIMFLVIAFFVFVITVNQYVFLWITMINIAISSSDIVSFIIICLKVPKNSLIFGNYYRCQQ